MRGYGFNIKYICVCVAVLSKCWTIVIYEDCLDCFFFLTIMCTVWNCCSSAKKIQTTYTTVKEIFFRTWMPFAVFLPTSKYWWIKPHWLGSLNIAVKITEYCLILTPCVEIWSLAWISTALNKTKQKRCIILWKPTQWQITLMGHKIGSVTLVCHEETWSHSATWFNLSTANKVFL